MGHVSTKIPSTPQAIFNAVVAARAIPWIPDDDADATELSWRQLVRENRVPATHANLINKLQRIAADPDALRTFAARNHLEFPACTP